MQTGEKASVVPESDCINDYGFRVITLKSPLSAVHGLLSEASAARIFDSLSLSRSVPALKRSRYAGTHDRCTSDSHGRDFERTSQRSTCTAQTLLSAQFWRAQPQILGRKSRIRKSHSHTCQLANPTAPVRASMKSARAWQVRIRASLHPENARGEEQENAKSARDRQKRGRF
jgi:hypothetical protein